MQNYGNIAAERVCNVPCVQIAAGTRRENFNYIADIYEAITNACSMHVAVAGPCGGYSYKAMLHNVRTNAIILQNGTTNARHIIEIGVFIVSR